MRVPALQLPVQPAPDCSLLADRLQLEVVIRNLLSNAFEAVAALPPDKRVVNLSAAKEGAGRVRINVEDSGPGLSGRVSATLFEPFQSTKASGLGLGLVISRAIAEAHGGTLWAEAGDHGAFRLVLPIEGVSSHGS